MRDLSFDWIDREVARVRAVLDPALKAARSPQEIAEAARVARVLRALGRAA